MSRLKQLATMLSLVALLTMGLALTAVPAAAQPPDATVTVEVPSIVPPGGSFVARLNITSVTDLSFATYRIAYDPSVLAVANVTDGLIGGSPAGVSAVNDWTNPESEWYGWDAAPGELGVVQGAYVAGEAGLSGSGYLAEIEFDVVGVWCDTSAISFVLEDSEAFAYDEQPINVEWVGTAVTVAPDYDVNGDGEVGFWDMIGVSVHWDETGLPWWIRADANRDGGVGFWDMILVSVHWGESCAS